MGISLSPAPSLSYVKSFISSAVTLGTHLTWTNITSVTLAPGIWDVTIQCLFRNDSATVSAFMMRLWDGTTTYLSDETGGGGFPAQFNALSACKRGVVDLSAAAGNTTLTLQASCFAGDTSKKVWEAAEDLNVGNNASGIVAVMIARGA